MVILKTNEIKLNPKNPRIIKNFNFKRLVQSVTDFPEMLNLRPIVVNKDMVILGGNMRYKGVFRNTIINQMKNYLYLQDKSKNN